MDMKYILIALTLLGVGTYELSGAMAQTNPVAAGAAAPGGQGVNPTTLPDDTYVILSGTVVGIVDKDEFELDSGNGVIKVDTNDGWPNLFQKDANNATRYLREGDRVIVTGKIDDNWSKGREVEAYSLRHERGDQIFSYEPKTRETNAPAFDMFGKSYNTYKGRATITGTIDKVEENGRYLMEYPGKLTDIRIDASKVASAPKFKVGDRVTVTGPVNDTLFTRREIEAESIMPAGSMGGGY